MQTGLDLIAASEQAAAMLHPVRRRLLEQFREPASAAEVARALELPRQRIGHHVRLLRRRGLLEPVGERRRGNFVEQLLQTSARCYVLAPQTLGALGEDEGAVRDRFSIAYLAASAARTLGDLAELKEMARRQQKKVPTMTLETEVRFRSPSEQRAFAEELARAVADLAGRYHDQKARGGRTFRFTLGGYLLPPSSTHTTPESERERS